MPVAESSAPELEPLAGDYCVATYPPVAAWKAEHNPALVTALGNPRPASPLAIYIHVPFCQKKCDYCYLVSSAGQAGHVINDYVETVLDELNFYSAFTTVAGRRLHSVYFGGGTPSVLSSEQARELIGGMKSVLPWKGIEEVTFECAPRSIRATFIETLLDLGVTRFSMGVQSLEDALLSANGRIHQMADVARAFEILRETGCRELNVDLMCGLPGETEAPWRDTVSRIIDLQPESVSVYQTEIRANTRTYTAWQAGALPIDLVSWEIKRERLAYAFSQLEANGYSVVSAYTAVKDPARDRLKYDDHLSRGGDVLGLGVAAFGYLEGIHYLNETALDSYSASVNSAVLPLARAFPLSPRDRFVREFVLQLKLGCAARDYFREKFSLDVVRAFETELIGLTGRGLLVVSNGEVRLTRAGLLRIDRLLPRFFDAAFRPAMNASTC